MAVLPTNFSVTSVRPDPIPNPVLPLRPPVVLPAQPHPPVGAPELLPPEDKAAVEAPTLRTPEEKPAVEAPTLLTPSKVDLVEPPFPRNHARILYANTLQANSGIVAPSGQSSSGLALIPNTFQRWRFVDGSTYTVTLTSARLIDTICIGAHNLGSLFYDLLIEYSPTLAGDDFVDFVPELFPQDNRAIMAHIDTAVTARRIRLTLSGVGTGEIGYISGGRALQMQRPFFQNHTPITDGDVTRYYHNETESGERIGQAIRSQGFETTAQWQNLDDGWYREYFAPFKQAAKLEPFFFAWNLLEYPLDVGFCWTDKDISAPMERGFNVRRSVQMDLKGHGNGL